MIRFENAGSADVSVITELFQDAFPEALLTVFGSSRLPSEVLLDLFTAVYRFEPGGFFVARQENRIVGFVIVTANLGRLYRHLLLREALFRMALRWLLGRYRGLSLGFIPRVAKLWRDYRALEKQSAVASTNAAQVLSIVVVPSLRRRGIGRRLTEVSLDYLRHERVRVVRLEVDAAKKGPIELYQEFGFKEVARLPTPRGPALVMIWYNNARDDP